MLSFLNIGILLGLIGVSIPLLIHLFAKRKQKKVYFSTLRFLKILQPQQLRRLRLKQILLMIIRSLIILFLVLGFSRPVCKESGSDLHSRSASVMSLIIDRSLSLKRKDMLPELKRKVRSVIEVMQPDDKALFIPTGNERKDPPGTLYNKKALTKMVDELTLSYSRGELSDKISETLTIFEKLKEPNKEIYVFTDLQATEWRTVPQDTSGDSWQGNIFFIPIRGENKNIGITQNSFKKGNFFAETTVNVSAGIENFSDSFMKDVLVRLSINHKTVDQLTVDLQKNAKKRIVFKAVPLNKGWNQGQISVQDGSFPYDDNFYFIYYLPSKSKIFLIGNNQDDILPISLSLKAQDKSRINYDIENFFMGSAWSTKLDSAHAAVFSNYPHFRSSEVEDLKDFFKRGGGVIFFMGNNIDIKRLNQQFFQPVADITLGDITRNKENIESSLGVRKVDYGHPLFQGVFEKGEEEFRSPRIFKSVELLGNNHISIIDLSTGFPLMVEKDINKGILLCFATSLEQSWSDFSLSTIFAPLMIRSTGYVLSQDLRAAEPALIGEEISLEISPELLEGDFYVQDPEGNRTAVLPRIEDGRIYLTLASARLPGIYKFFHNTSQIGLRAVNIDSRESDLDAIAFDSIKELFPESEIYLIDNIENLKKVVLRTRFGRELWKEMVIVVLGLLLIEMILAKSPKKSYPEK